MSADGRMSHQRWRPDPVTLDLPFRGRWAAQNSPSRRIPSHGTHLMGTTYAIDFIAVGDDGRSAPRTWRTLVLVERPELFAGFGAPILSPVAATVAMTHDGEDDHVARRSQFALLPYALGQARRIKQGAGAIAGNHVVVELGPTGPYVLLAHLRRGSVCVAVGDVVAAGDQVGECGNSGNSTEPHVHVQVTDSMDWPSAQGLPMVFARPGGDGVFMPGESEIVNR